MAQLTYLQLTNAVLNRINEPEVSTATTVAGKVKIITDLLKEGQVQIWNETNWHTLFRVRAFQTVVYTASTISFLSTGTISDSASGFGDFMSQGYASIVVSGSTSNDGEYMMLTVDTSNINVQSSEVMTTEAEGDSVTISMITYPLASDFGRCVSLQDVTNGTVLTESVGRVFDETDPEAEDTGDPQYFTIQDAGVGSFYRVHPAPDSTATLRDRYMALPTAFAVNGEYSTLPIECDNALIEYALWGVKEYLKDYEGADRSRAKYEWHLSKAVASNDKIIDKLYAGKRKAKYY